jgi:hypothetical protein
VGLGLQHGARATGLGDDDARLPVRLDPSRCRGALESFWGLVIVGVVWLARSLAETARGPRRDDPLEILDRRLASGEITPEEYRERRATLGSGTEDSGPGGTT